MVVGSSPALSFRGRVAQLVRARISPIPLLSTKDIKNEFSKLKTIKLENLTKKFILISNNGTLAQLVEQWTENPCVPGSNPGGTTNSQYAWSVY